jgi:hypothetical protein
MNAFAAFRLPLPASLSAVGGYYPSAVETG